MQSMPDLRRTSVDALLQNTAMQLALCVQERLGSTKLDYTGSKHSGTMLRRCREVHLDTHGGALDQKPRVVSAIRRRCHRLCLRDDARR